MGIDLTENFYDWTFLKVVVSVSIGTSEESDSIRWVKRLLILLKPDNFPAIESTMPLLYTENNSYYIEERYGPYETDPYDQQSLVSLYQLPIIVVER